MLRSPNADGAKIDRHIAYIDNKIEGYTRALAEHDGDNQQLIVDTCLRGEVLTISRASADVGFMFFAYILRRIGNI